jgi:hypothetical protein
VGLVKSASLTKYLLNAPNLTLNFRKNKWDIAAYYANEKGTNWMENQFVTTVRAAEGNYKKTGYYTEDNHNQGVHYYRLGIGYTLSKRTSLSAQYDGLSHYFTLDVKQNGDYLTPSLQLTGGFNVIAQLIYKDKFKILSDIIFMNSLYPLIFSIRT